MKTTDELYEAILLRMCGEANDDIPLAEAAGDRERLNRAMERGAAFRGLYAEVQSARLQQVKDAVASGSLPLEEGKKAIRLAIGNPGASIHTVTSKPVEIECGRVRIVTDGFGRGNVYFDGVETDLSIAGLKYEVAPGKMEKLHLTVNPALPRMQPDVAYTNSVLVEQILKACAVKSTAGDVVTPVMPENNSYDTLEKDVEAITGKRFVSAVELVREGKADIVGGHKTVNEVRAMLGLLPLTESDDGTQPPTIVETPK